VLREHQRQGEHGHVGSMTLNDGAAHVREAWPRNLKPVDDRRPKRVAIVVSNAANSTTTGWPVDFWWTELAYPFHAFEERKYEIDDN
jgi:hypothetical protein